LVKKLDKATLANKSARMGSFVIFCTDAEAMEKKLKALGKKEKLEKVVLAIDNRAGPDGWNIAKDADVTVVLYNKRKVAANFAFKKGELKAKDIDAILAALPKILPDKK
jgi:hypothetical protein